MERKMKKKIVNTILIGSMLGAMLTGCGTDSNSDNYTEYIRQAKAEINNEDFVKANDYLKYAEEEKEGDRTVQELSDQIEQYQGLEECLVQLKVGIVTEEDLQSMEAKVAEAKEFVEEEYLNGLMINRIKTQIEELSVAMEQKKESLAK